MLHLALEECMHACMQLGQLLKGAEMVVFVVVCMKF